MIRIDIYGSKCSDNPTSGSPPVGSPLYESVCGQISVDVNGAQGPNQMGRDFFISI